MSADVDAGSADGGPEPDLLYLGDGIVADYEVIEGGRLRLTFYADADTADPRQICVVETDPDFYDRPENERGHVKNRLLDAIDEHCDDVSEQIVLGGYEELCRTFAGADVTEEEDMRSPIVNQLLRETDRVEMHAGDDSATITVRLSRAGGPGVSIDFASSEWTSNDCGGKIREQYHVAHQEPIEIEAEEWETLRDVWNDQIERVVRDEGTEDDETAHELVRRLASRIKVTEDYDEIRNDPKIALYDRNNADREDSEIADRHGDVDVLWIQTVAISEVLDDLPGDTPPKNHLARRLIDDDTLLRGRKGLGADKLPVGRLIPSRSVGEGSSARRTTRARIQTRTATGRERYDARTQPRRARRGGPRERMPWRRQDALDLPDTRRARRGGRRL